MRSHCDESTSAPDSPASAAPPSAFDDFFRARYPHAVRLAHLLTGSNAVAEELAQDAFARIYARFDTLDSPEAYLRVTVVNVCRNWQRYRQREQSRFRRHGLTVIDSVDDTGESDDELLSVIAALPYRQRAVLVMRYWLDLSEADMATTLDCRPGTVKSLHSRALASIRKELP